MKIARLSGCENFVGKRDGEVYIQCVTLSQWIDLSMGVIYVDLGA